MTVEQRARARAAELGSQATTLRGIVRFLRGRSDRAHRPNLPHETRQLILDWKRAQQERRSHRDAKRARDDRKFRRRYLAKLRRRERKICDTDLSTLAVVVQRYADHEKLYGELKHIEKMREILTGSGWREKLPLGGAVKVPISETTSRRVKAPINMRGKDANLYPTMRSSYGIHESGETEWKGSTPVKYTRAVHQNYVRSMALVVSPRRVEVLLHNTAFTVELPPEYEWRTADGHLSLVRLDSQRDDYHPDAGDLLDGASHCGDVLERNREIRRRLEAERAVDIADAAGVWVCVNDSFRAGNCRSMTLDFAQRHGFNAKRHYPAKEVLIRSNGDYARVKLAVKSAMLRHQSEMDQGFCKIG